MSDSLYFGLGVLGSILVVCGLVLLITHEVKKGPSRKPNVRVPRETLWERTREYHRGQ